MIRYYFSTEGIIEHELTVDERQTLADLGDLEAKREIVIEQMSEHSSPFEHLGFLYNLFGIKYPPD